MSLTQQSDNLLKTIITKGKLTRMSLRQKFLMLASYLLIWKFIHATNSSLFLTQNSEAESFAVRRVVSGVQFDSFHAEVDVNRAEAVELRATA